MDIHYDAGGDLPDNISVTSSHGSLSRLETAKVDFVYAEKEIEPKQNKAILEENEKILKAKLERQRAEIENKLVLLDKQKQVEISELEVKKEQSSVCSRPQTPEPNKYIERYFPTPYHDRPMPILDLQMDGNGDLSSNPDRPMPVLNSQTDGNGNQSPKPVVNRDINNNTNNLSTTQNPQEDLANFLLKRDLMLHRRPKALEEVEEFRQKAKEEEEPEQVEDEVVEEESKSILKDTKRRKVVFRHRRLQTAETGEMYNVETSCMYYGPLCSGEPVIGGPFTFCEENKSTQTVVSSFQCSNCNGRLLL